jgi:tetratricopeptide (TPR) repeat protein
MLLGVLLFVEKPLAQNSSAKAQNLYAEGISLMESGKIADADKKFLDAKKTDPDNLSYLYVEAYKLHKKKSYDEAIVKLQQLIKTGKPKSNAYRLLGNCYELKNDVGNAIQAYQSGLKAYPHSAELLMEMGISQMGKKDYKSALDYFEKGIQYEPSFASNYLLAAKLLNQTPEKVWVFIYGEIFMNLERNTDRTIEAGIMLYDAYKTAFTKKSDTAQYLQITKMWIKEPGRSGTIIKPKFRPSFEQTFTASLSSSTIRKDFDLATLYNYRNNFLSDWFNENHQKDFPNPLFNYLKSLKDQGKFEMYNNWLFQEGDPANMAKWYSKNTTKFDEFLNWFGKNQFKLVKADKTTRLQYWNH